MPHIHSDLIANYDVGRVLFMGEVAVFLNPVGEGISAEMGSEYYAAESIINNSDVPNLVCPDYKEKTALLYNYMKRKWNLIAQMTDTFKEMKV